MKKTIIATGAIALLLYSCGNETPKKTNDTLLKPDSIAEVKEPAKPVERLDPNDTVFEWKSSIDIGGNHSDFAVYPNGLIVTTSHQQDSVIQIFSPEGKLIRAFGKKGRENGSFRTFPDQVAIAPNGTIFCSDGTEPQVLAFDSTGKYLFTMNVGGGQLIAGLTVNSKGTVLVSLATGWMVKAFDSSGKFLRDMKEVKNKGGVLWGYLAGISVDSADNIYLCNWRDFGANGAAVHISDSAGTYLKTLTDFKINHSTVMFTADRAGRIYMENTTEIKVFNSDGKPIAVIGKEGNENGQFESESIRTIKVNAAGYVYVLDNTGKRIQIFR